jgi:hypothetical protein
VVPCVAIVAAHVLFGSLSTAARQPDPVTVHADGGVLRARVTRRPFVLNDFDAVPVRRARHRSRPLPAAGVGPTRRLWQRDARVGQQAAHDDGDDVSTHSSRNIDEGGRHKVASIAAQARIGSNYRHE